MVLREEHAQATRDAIVKAARKMFASKGYDASSIDDIAAAARVTSGALYHHFRNKREIMRAVFETMDDELARRVKAAAGGTKDAMDRMQHAIRALLGICQEEEIRSIIYQQAPRVLGWEEYRTADESIAIAGLVDDLSDLRKQRKIGNYDNRLLASMFLALMNEAGFQMAANRKKSLLAECERIMQAFLNGL
jgi:AcrR family transcriptional regulator